MSKPQLKLILNPDFQKKTHSRGHLRLTIPGEVTPVKLNLVQPTQESKIEPIVRLSLTEKEAKLIQEALTQPGRFESVALQMKINHAIVEAHLDDDDGCIFMF